MIRSTAILLVITSFTFCGCEDQAGDPIVINSDENVGSCVFTNIENDFQACLNETSDDELEVVTWNIERFPVSGTTTIQVVENIIYNTNADVIALQEIISISDFEAIVNNLTDWEGEILNISGDLNMGYIYKSCDISTYTEPVTFSIIEPRPAVATTIKHINGLEVTLFNIHLKCCGSDRDVDRRRAASENLKNFIDNNYASANVIVLGDFNDDLNSDSPFLNFINDAANYSFATNEIAAGSSSNWSYPSWPSHLDHILISNELFDNLIYTETLKFSDCVSNYSSSVSDHRPVMSVFKADE